MTAKTKQREHEVADLQDLANIPKVVSAFGRTYEIRKFTLGPATRALEYIGPLGFLLRSFAEFPRDDKGKLIPSADMIQTIVSAISISGDSVMGLISVATSEPKEWLDDQDTIEGLEILAAVVEKNLDFFSQANIDKITQMFGGLQAKIPNLGGSTATN